MKKKTTILASIGLSLLLSTNAFAATTFTDINDSYAKTEINKLAEMGIVDGNGDGTFKPTQNITRDEFAKILCVSLGLDQDASGAAQFTDVEDWARGYVGALVTEGITQGTGDSTYGGTEQLTREQMAALFVRAMYAEEIAQALYDDGDIQLTFADQASIDDYAKADVALAQKIGFIKGDGTNFDPSSNAERQAVARLAYEYTVNSETYANAIVGLANDYVSDHQVQ